MFNLVKIFGMESGTKIPSSSSDRHVSHIGGDHLSQNGLAMGLATTFVLVCASTLVSIVRKLVPKEVRIPVYIVIATFVTIVDLF